MLKALETPWMAGSKTDPLRIHRDSMCVCVEISDDKENTEGQRLLTLTEAQIREKTEKTEKLWRIPPTYELTLTNWLLVNALYLSLCYLTPYALDCYALLSNMLYQ